MRRITTTVLLLIFTHPLFAQTWKVELDDIYDDDPDLDRISAEAVELLPDGKTILTTGKFYLKGVENRNNGEILLWNVKDGSLKTRLTGKAEVYSLRANSLACSPDGKRIAAAGRMENGGRIVDVFDLTKLKHTHTLKGDPSFLTGLRFSPKKNVLAVAHADGINFWNPDTGKKVGGSSKRARSDVLHFRRMGVSSLLEIRMVAFPFWIQRRVRNWGR